MEAAPQALQQVALKQCSGRSQFVEAPQPVLSRDDQTGPAQIGQMTRGLGLWDSENLHQVAHADLASQEQVKDSQAGAIRERPEHQVDRFPAQWLYSPRRL